MKIDTTFRRGAATLALAAAFAGTLTACAPLVIGGAAAVGAMMVVDRRTSGTQIEDETIELRGASRMAGIAGSAGHIALASYNRQVLLTGEVPTEQAKQNAEQAALRIENVKGVVNELAVRPATSLTERSNDTLLTGKVKATIVDDKHLSIAAFRIVTERGTVYMMGRVTQAEADRATQLVRNIPGVQRVVRVFEIISDAELQKLVSGGATAAPAAAPASAPKP
jgi:osmotically-inducible protein OsmY